MPPASVSPTHRCRLTVGGEREEAQTPFTLAPLYRGCIAYVLRDPAAIKAITSEVHVMRGTWDTHPNALGVVQVYAHPRRFGSRDARNPV
jgi:hypothetical protein